MKIHQGYNNLKFHEPVVTIGIFDGVHRGHRVLIDTLTRRAEEKGGESVVITFDPHPRLVVAREQGSLAFLSDIGEKIRLLQEAGVDHLIVVNFTPAFRRMSACDFVEKVLTARIGTGYLVMGHDHHFGYRAKGNYETVNECARDLGFVVERVTGLKSGKGFVSSSLIREALLKGDLNNANKWLGYSYQLRGKVVAGKKLGRKLGYPTANLRPVYRYKLIPANGVYAVETVVRGDIKPGMLSIGSNPTVNTAEGKRHIEVNIFDFDEDIYGEEIEVLFRYRLRDEIRFGSVEALALQMNRDRSMALKLLSATKSV
ncbi:MAG TPA: bifunctional riboflavin kinase/FAD synthetase [Bacteroidales bacterium]|mgnify:CR=1 FL=1|nr:bifunctional riboflavin kinase/FAD synthetase [Bacteroidales bacterium]HPF01835.1 bifunctional riboflavin kinase/FAD synthetase [Bacteroidales bacterium]HPJ59893.1 bifunctional riboflavin kinase/FAD synthetase [Bacteroidales bacterium]HPR11356.1 bifunctional riboflavin kinase/FAD synthetase [Bacteroidales bacterium]HRW85729.1 bifunctional riboflavin kinase/FAD synthetase [Bacteroidales bacterium]